MKTYEKNDDGFELYDLRVEVVKDKGSFVCAHKMGDYFELRGEQLFLPDRQGLSIYALAALIPLLTAKQRMTHPNDFMTTDTEVACPDPLCGARFRITRIGKSSFKHSDISAVPLKSKK